MKDERCQTMIHEDRAPVESSEDMRAPRQCKHAWLSGDLWYQGTAPAQCEATLPDILWTYNRFISITLAVQVHSINLQQQWCGECGGKTWCLSCWCNMCVFVGKTLEVWCSRSTMRWDKCDENGMIKGCRDSTFLDTSKMPDMMTGVMYYRVDWSVMNLNMHFLQFQECGKCGKQTRSQEHGWSMWTIHTVSQILRYPKNMGYTGALNI